MAKWLRGLRSKTWRGVDWLSGVDNPIIDIVLLYFQPYPFDCVAC